MPAAFLTMNDAAMFALIAVVVMGAALVWLAVVLGFFSDDE